MSTDDHTTNPPLKRCKTCGEEKPATFEFFYKQGKFLRQPCKLCILNAYVWKRAKPPKPPKGFKRCTKCNTVFPATLEYFYNKATENRMCSECKQCHSKVAKVYRESHREQFRESERRWRAAHPHRPAEIARAYRKRNPARVREANKQYYATHPEHRKAAKHRRRARKANAGGTYNQNDIKLMRKACHNKCYYCGSKFVDDRFHVDHIVPLSRGGTNSLENLVLACPHCNQTKNNKLPHEWPEGGRLL